MRSTSSRCCACWKPPFRREAKGGSCGGPPRSTPSRPLEQQVLDLLGKGLIGAAIGRLLGISPRMVAKHLENAYAKLGCTNRIDGLCRPKGQ